MLPVVKELTQRGWVNKRWQTLKNGAVGGNAFTKSSLHKLLSNPIYIGQVTYKRELHPGQQPVIVDPQAWQQVQILLDSKGPEKNVSRPAKERALLQGLLFCRNCGCAMTPSITSKATKKYRYYVCTSAQTRGWHTCPSKSIPAAQIERFVVDQIRAVIRERQAAGVASSDGCELDESVAATLTAFDANWEMLTASEQGQMLRLLVSEVSYDGVLRSVAVTLRDDKPEEQPAFSEE